MHSFCNASFLTDDYDPITDTKLQYIYSPTPERSRFNWMNLSDLYFDAAANVMITAYADYNDGGCYHDKR